MNLKIYNMLSKNLKKFCYNLNKTINKPENNDLLSILDELVVINYHDKKNVCKALKMLLNYSNEPGINLSDVTQLLSEIIENL